jgi:hypothetical protein
MPWRSPMNVASVVVEAVHSSLAYTRMPGALTCFSGWSRHKSRLHLGRLRVRYWTRRSRSRPCRAASFSIRTYTPSPPLVPRPASTNADFPLDPSAAYFGKGMVLEIWMHAPSSPSAYSHPPCECTGVAPFKGQSWVAYR